MRVYPAGQDTHSGTFSCMIEYLKDMARPSNLKPTLDELQSLCVRCIKCNVSCLFFSYDGSNAHLSPFSMLTSTSLPIQKEVRQKAHDGWHYSRALLPGIPGHRHVQQYFEMPISFHLVLIDELLHCVVKRSVRFSWKLSKTSAQLFQICAFSRNTFM